MLRNLAVIIKKYFYINIKKQNFIFQEKIFTVFI